MAFTYALGQARTSSAANPITFSYTISNRDAVVCLMLKVNGATDRAGGAPTWGGFTFIQANQTQKAATSPEASTELWYLVNANSGADVTNTLTIPNTGALTIFRVIGLGRTGVGGDAFFNGASGANNTSTNPASGAIATAQPLDIIFATVASGATTWAPTARTGTQIQDTDDGAHGGGTQYLIKAAAGAQDMSWTFGTSDDWGAVAAAFSEIQPYKIEHYKLMQADGNMSVNIP